MRTGWSAASRETRIKLQWVSLVVGVALSIVAIYDISQGQHSTSVWIAIVCWPLVSVLSVVQLIRLRQ
ncbi:hypothetical protein [Rhodococcoides kyotonense]|uniref:Uncharacterized protein n=1 Tax=Rhodococcoides kyotonense TaxID=398843 RepID=A0A239J1N9_9NOCA|nr:hypothetical protein [Rhodococcus kyotonensis]SNS99740.1 hypothetical protein SAMN05421642_1087 [Rhodococcus kyotonensis]